MPRQNVSLFQYGAKFESLAQNAETTQTIRVDSGVDFLAQGMMVAAQLDSSSTPTGAAANQLLYRDPLSAIADLTMAHLGMVTAKLQVTDYTFQNIAVPLNLIAGTAERPFMFPTEIYVPSNDTIQVTLKNNLPSLTGVSAPAIDVWVMFIGKRVTQGS